MSSINDFIAELLRAANELDRLNYYERSRLLDRAVVTIRDMREAVGIPESRNEADAIIHISSVAFEIENGETSDEKISRAILDAAAMIRDLHIVLHTETEIHVVGNGDRD